MRTTVRLLGWLLLGSAALAGGCGSDHKNPRRIADPLENVTGFCEEWGKRACNQLVADACLAKSLEECAAAQAVHCVNTMKPNYDKKNAVACLDEVQKAYADAKLTAAEHEVVVNLRAPCDKLFEGPGTAGFPCTANHECNTLENFECVIHADGQGTCEVPEVQAGGFPCAAPYQVCGEAFYCNGQNCLVRPAVGQPCSMTVPCTDDATCVGIEGAGVCTAKLADREACTDPDECVSGICAFSGTNGRCAPHILLDAADPLCDNFAQ
jgi:hypothetical protein